MVSTGGGVGGWVGRGWGVTSGVAALFWNACQKIRKHSSWYWITLSFNSGLTLDALMPNNQPGRYSRGSESVSYCLPSAACMVTSGKYPTKWMDLGPKHGTLPSILETGTNFPGQNRFPSGFFH